MRPTEIKCAALDGSIVCILSYDGGSSGRISEVA